MRTLDRYVVRNFLYTTLLFFVVMMSLRIVVDLFVNIDEFSEQSDTMPFVQIAMHIASYYFYNCSIYFIELGGVIIVASAAFTLAMMNHSNELTAMLASGVSLQRVCAPIIVCSLLMGGLIVADQELLIPRIPDKLIRSQEEATKGNLTEFPVRLINDEQGKVWIADMFSQATGSMKDPTIIVRDKSAAAAAFIFAKEAKPVAASSKMPAGWRLTDGKLCKVSRSGEVSWRNTPSCSRIFTQDDPKTLLERNGLKQDAKNNISNLKFVDKNTNVEFADSQYNMEIRAKRFVPEPYDKEKPDKPRQGLLEKPVFTFFDTPEAGSKPLLLAQVDAESARWQIDATQGGYWELSGATMFVPSDLTVKEIVLRQSGHWMDFMSMADITKLLELKKIQDTYLARMTKHLRVTQPFNNLVMLLLGLPFILSRERNIRASASLCLLTVSLFYAFIYLCRYIGLDPVWAAWLPILLFGPISIVMLDSVKS